MNFQIYYHGLMTTQLSVIIILLTIIGLYFINENSDITTVNPKEEIEVPANSDTDTETNVDQNNSENPKTNNKNKQEESVNNVDNKPTLPNSKEISYDYSCLEDEKDMGSTGLINIFSVISAILI